MRERPTTLRDTGNLVMRRPTPFAGEVPYLATADVTDSAVVPSESCSFIGRPARAGLMLRAGDVLQAKMAATDKAVLVTNEMAGWLASTGFAQFNPDPQRTDPRFLYQWLRSDQFVRLKEPLCVGSTQQAINQTDLGGIRVCFPNIQSQQRIAEILSTVDEAIEQTEALIAKTQAIKAGLMHDLFTRGVLPNGQLRPPREQAPELYKPSPLGWIPSEWAVSSVGDWGEVFNGTTPSREVPSYWRGSIPWLSSGKVNEYRVESADEYVTTRALNETSLRIVARGSVIVAMVGQGRTRGMSARLEIAATINQNLAAVIPKAEMSGVCLHLLLDRSYERLRNTGRGSNRDALNTQLVRAFPLVMPRVDEQPLIAEIILSIEAQVAAAEARVVSLGCIRCGLMHDLLTGRVRVPMSDASARVAPAEPSTA